MVKTAGWILLLFGLAILLCLCFIAVITRLDDFVLWCMKKPLEASVLVGSVALLSGGVLLVSVADDDSDL